MWPWLVQKLECKSGVPVATRMYVFHDRSKRLQSSDNVRRAAVLSYEHGHTFPFPSSNQVSSKMTQKNAVNHSTNGVACIRDQPRLHAENEKKRCENDASSFRGPRRAWGARTKIHEKNELLRRNTVIRTHDVHKNLYNLQLLL